jgi:hypothetical protein
MRVKLSNLRALLGKAASSEHQAPQDPAAQLQGVYDGVLRQVIRSGQARPVREVQQLLAARMREVFGDNPRPISRPWLRDAEELAAGRRVVVTEPPGNQNPS